MVQHAGRTCGLVWASFVLVACEAPIKPPMGADAGVSDDADGGTLPSTDPDAGNLPEPTIVPGPIEFERGLGKLGIVYDVAFGHDSLLVAYELPLATNTNRWPVNDGNFSAVRVGLASLDRQTVRGDIPLVTDIDIEPLLEDGVVRQYYGDQEATIAYVPGDDEFVVAWTRAYHDRDDSSIKYYNLFAQRVDAKLGTIKGTLESPLVVADPDEYNYDRYQVDIAHDAQSDSLLVIWAKSDDCINCGGGKLSAKLLTRDNQRDLVVPDEPVIISETAKWPSLESDNNGQFLVTYTVPQVGNVKPYIAGHRVMATRNGDDTELSVGEMIDLVAPLEGSWAWFDSQVAYDSDLAQFMVSYTQPWDMVVRPVTASPTGTLEPPNVIDISDHDYSPTIGYVGGSQKYLLSFGRDGTDFFDCLNDVSAVWVSPNGTLTNDPLMSVNPDFYTGMWRSRTAGHPQFKAAAVAWSKMSDPCEWEADASTIEGAIIVNVIKTD